MKKPFSTLMLAACCAGISAPTWAQEYMFTYSKLYSQMKNNVKENHEDVKVGFFFVDADSKQLCRIEKAWMEKEEHYEELTQSSGNELVVPLDNNLRQANPLVFVDTPNDRRCDFSMVVLTKQPLQGKVSYAQVEKLLPQMQSMLEDLGGMFASWFTPAVTGVTLEFAHDVNSPIELSNGSTIPVINGKAQVELSQIGPDGWMSLPQATTRVLPYLPKAKK
ncbi:DUF2987 domain-containing protein [Vibrio fluvialis]|uniref:DUF2987 domain-containing protein n=1 Tax=Vibrio fluvialis TaxID=676 RepID=UPI001C9D04BC|nr:DUF2987 domain-containing protein [Vibrio fluvialis]MBY7977338.1 DUF2987 domain-containing protein [Vibrio fluvialis]